MRPFYLLITFMFFFLPFTFISAQQPEWYLHYSTGNVFDFFLDIQFVNGEYGWVGGKGAVNAKLLKTSDGGISWVEIQEPLFATDVIRTVFFIDTLQGWLGMDKNRLLKTVDGGYNWTEQALGIPDAPVLDIYFRNELEGWAVGGGVAPGIPTIEKGFIKRTTDGGNTWQLVNVDTTNVKTSISFSDSLHGLALGWHPHVYTTQDGGITWDLNNNFVSNYSFTACTAISDSSFIIIGSVLDANGYNLYPLYGKSTNWGQSWDFTIWQTSEVESFSCTDFIDSQNGWFGAKHGKFIYTNDGGQTFQIYNTGIEHDICAIQMLDENNGWACGTGWGPIFKYGIPTEISSSLDVTPAENFILLQNFPNPFNPTTTIAYQLPKRSRVKLKIYDITGRRVKTLKDEVQPAGNYQTTWDGTDEFGNAVASGVYVSRLIVLAGSNQYESAKKMLLLR